MPEGAKSLVLLNVYPNPFRERTVISYQLPVIGKSKEPITDYRSLITDHRSPITLEIYDLSGRFVRTLPITDHRSQITEVVWDGRDNNGVLLPAGVYFYRWKGEGFNIQGKLVMIR